MVGKGRGITPTLSFSEDGLGYRNRRTSSNAILRPLAMMLIKPTATSKKTLISNHLLPYYERQVEFRVFYGIGYLHFRVTAYFR